MTISTQTLSNFRKFSCKITLNTYLRDPKPVWICIFVQICTLHACKVYNFIKTILQRCRQILALNQIAEYFLCAKKPAKDWQKLHCCGLIAMNRHQVNVFKLQWLFIYLAIYISLYLSIHIPKNLYNRDPPNRLVLFECLRDNSTQSWGWRSLILNT